MEISPCDTWLSEVLETSSVTLRRSRGIVCTLTFHLLATKPKTSIHIQQSCVCPGVEHDFSNFLSRLDLSLLTGILRVFNWLGKSQLARSSEGGEDRLGCCRVCVDACGSERLTRYILGSTVQWVAINGIVFLFLYSSALVCINIGIFEKAHCWRRNGSMFEATD